MKNFLLPFFALIGSMGAWAQGTPDTLVIRTAMITEPEFPRREFLPKGHLFEPILLDPLEAQTSVSVLPGYWTEGKKYDGSIVPFTFGLRKPIIRWYKSAERSTELSFDVASFTQFEVYHDDKLNKQKRQLMNTDYRISFLYNIRVRNHSWRLRLYHLSSHLGDDYLFRNQINYYLPNPVNYELVDVTYSHEKNGLRKYAGIGIGLRKPEERKRLSAEAGFYYRKPSQAFARFVGGIDLKLWQQTDFRPGIKAGLGLELGRTANNLTFLIETYTGFRPYSVYENQKTRWLGIGVYFNPI
ncbi:DUF1207 domain-containing protein [Larkinella terrae]|uniref:DUF1207 domain-containing protein n=1 Tax=Larkinella terrae TaxID=2025311 RepID=A0A7K0ENE8_9BACT|nr:DUF1207 domain-containing protein [Larkinella terrae]MRS63319.1 DUF1207 domain-containing protein [Larkinella terrae]